MIQTPLSRSAHTLGSPAKGRTIEWRVSLRVKHQFYDLLHELVELEHVPWEPEVASRMEALRDDIRALPGYPRRYDPERDVIVPVVTSEQA